MKKVRVLGIVLLFSALTIFLTANIFAQNVIAHADELLNETLLSINGLFSKKTIEETGYLYNLDESADYVYVDFAGCTGYAIFAEETMELLEYATVGVLTYAF